MDQPERVDLSHHLPDEPPPIAWPSHTPGEAEVAIQGGGNFLALQNMVLFGVKCILSYTALFFVNIKHTHTHTQSILSPHSDGALENRIFFYWLFRNVM